MFKSVSTDRNCIGILNENIFYFINICMYTTMCKIKGVYFYLFLFYDKSSRGFDIVYRISYECELAR